MVKFFVPRIIQGIENILQDTEAMAYKESSSVDHHRISDAGTTNAIILSDPETWVARSLLSETLREVEHFDLEIARVQAILDTLNAKRDEAVARADRLRAAIAPHKRVPQEVLAEIFAHTVEGMPFTLYFLSRQCWPWPLRSVCSLWRRIIISDRRLWNSVEVLAKEWSPSEFHRLHPVLSHIRDQFPSGSGPSKLTINVEGDVWISPHRLDHPIAELFSPSWPFLRELHLTLPLSWCLTLFKSPTLNVPRLETFSLACDADDIEDPDPDNYKLFEHYLLSTDAFCNAESLRKLRMRHFALFECLEDAPFPWDQLTDLDSR